MSTILVSANERSEIKEALGDMGMSVDLPFDFLLYTNRGKVGAERKFFPDDMLSSVRDGRLARETAAMREMCDFRIVIREGEGRYTRDGKLKMRGKPTAWTKPGIRNLFRSIRYVEGCDLEYSDDITDTVEVLKELQKYFDLPTHQSLHVRPKFESSWLMPVYQERLNFFYQGLPGISVVRARLLSQKFTNPMALFSASIEEIMEISGIGQTLAARIVRFLRGEEK